jgi:hypothetical protein
MWWREHHCRRTVDIVAPPSSLIVIKVQNPHVTPAAEATADAIQAFSAMRCVRTVITTDSESEMEWPTSDGGNENRRAAGPERAMRVANPSFGRTPFFFLQVQQQADPHPA